MSRLTLVNPPLGRYDDAELAAPLSLAELRWRSMQFGHEVAIVDLNCIEYRELADDPNEFYENALGEILQNEPEGVGITSMGVNTHVALKLAERLSALGIRSIVGGFHAVAVKDWIDSLKIGVEIWNGESVGRPESSFPWWAGALDLGASLKDLYDGIDLAKYFRQNHRAVLNYEAGRGCKYKCSYCYRPSMGAMWKTRPVDDVVRDFQEGSRLGAKHIFVVDDNFYNDPSWARGVIAELAKTPLISWNAYATLRDLKVADVEPIARSGCKSIFVGVETVALRQQRQWMKVNRDAVNHSTVLVEAAQGTGFTFTMAFIVDLLPTSDEETELTLLHAYRLAKLGSDVRVSVMAHYPGTMNFKTIGQVRGSRARCEILLDVPAVVVENPYATAFPGHNPWHSAPRGVADWRARVLAVAMAQALFQRVRVGAISAVEFDKSRGLWHSLVLASNLLLAQDMVIHKTELSDALIALFVGGI